jgi:hypothetical protein
MNPEIQPPSKPGNRMAGLVNPKLTPAEVAFMKEGAVKTDEPKEPDELKEVVPPEKKKKQAANRRTPNKTGVEEQATLFPGIDRTPPVDLATHTFRYPKPLIAKLKKVCDAISELRGKKFTMQEAAALAIQEWFDRNGVGEDGSIKRSAWRQ